MDTQQVSHGIDLVNQLTQAGAATALLFALVLGLGFAMAAKVPAHEFIQRDKIANWTVYMVCILGGFLACWLLWPETMASGVAVPWRAKLAFSLSIAFGTPLIWIVIVALLGLIRPTWARALSLHRINFESATEASENDVPGQPKE
jgi:hypothetical protein